jgi:hypothetical protein
MSVVARDEGSVTLTHRSGVRVTTRTRTPCAVQGTQRVCRMFVSSLLLLLLRRSTIRVGSSLA